MYSWAQTGPGALTLTGIQLHPLSSLLVIALREPQMQFSAHYCMCWTAGRGTVRSAVPAEVQAGHWEKVFYLLGGQSLKQAS